MREDRLPVLVGEALFWKFESEYFYSLRGIAIVLQGLIERLLDDPFTLMNTIGLVAFALVGAAKAIRERFDLFGVTVVGLVTAFAGGITRDILVNRVPLALQSLGEISLGMLGVALAVGLSFLLDSPDNHPVTLISDAIGLAAFTTTGAIVATDTGVSSFGVIAISTINAVGGGAFADILLDRSPFILFDGFYASCAVLGGSTYLLVRTMTGDESAAAMLCVMVTMITRIAAVNYGWDLPTPQMFRITRDEVDDNQ